MYKSVLERIWQATLRGEEQQLLDLIRLGMSISTLAHHIDDSSMSRIETPASESPTNSNKLIQEENLDQPMASRSNVSRYSTVASQLSTAEVDQLLQEANASAEQSTIPLERHGWHPSLQIPSPPASFAKQSGLPQAVGHFVHAAYVADRVSTDNVAAHELSVPSTSKLQGWLNVPKKAQ